MATVVDILKQLIFWLRLPNDIQNLLVYISETHTAFICLVFVVFILWLIYMLWARKRCIGFFHFYLRKMSGRYAYYYTHKTSEMRYTDKTNATYCVNNELFALTKEVIAVIGRYRVRKYADLSHVDKIIFEGGMSVFRKWNDDIKGDWVYFGISLGNHLKRKKSQSIKYKMALVEPLPHLASHIDDVPVRKVTLFYNPIEGEKSDSVYLHVYDGRKDNPVISKKLDGTKRPISKVIHYPKYGYRYVLAWNVDN